MTLRKSVLNTDDAFKELNGKTINLHTNLKGKLKKKGRGLAARYEFVENEKEISDEDLKALRKLSREIDHNTSQYHCIVSVLMLREGWDVRNVTTIVPLRPYSSKANILPEQTLGRGLRRMSPPGKSGAHELVTVVEHRAFASLYQEELAQEGLFVDIVDISHIPKTTVSIFPDRERKDIDNLEIKIPALTAGYTTSSKIENFSIDDVKRQFSKYSKLPLGAPVENVINYEGRHLFTNEVIERIKIHLPLLETGVGAISYFVKQLEEICKIRGIHSVIASILESFLQEILFEKKTNLADPKLVARIGDSDVGEHIRAVFVPLIRSRIIKKQERIKSDKYIHLSKWRSFQVTHNDNRPVIEANRTPFNLVPCNRELERAFAEFAEKTSDVKAFAKNAGPQALRIDYLSNSGNLAFYTPDFFIRLSEKKYFLVETKGQVDRDVPRKAKAAITWCESASKSGVEWKYLYIPQDVFERESGNTIAGLARSCAPALQNLMQTAALKEDYPLFADIEVVEKKMEALLFAAEEELNRLPNKYRDSIEQATVLFQFLKNKEGMNFAPAFNSLLGIIDDACTRVIIKHLQKSLPRRIDDQKAWFAPYIDDGFRPGSKKHFEQIANNLKRTLVFSNGLSPTGLLRNCLEYTLQDSVNLGGVFSAVKSNFSFTGNEQMYKAIVRVNDFRNQYVAHQEKELKDKKQAEQELKHWVQALIIMSKAIKA